MAGQALGFIANLQDYVERSPGFYAGNLFGGANFTGTKRRRAVLFDVARDIHRYNAHLSLPPNAPPPNTIELLNPQHLYPVRARSGPTNISNLQPPHRTNANAVPQFADAAALGTYANSIAPLVLPGTNNTESGARAYLRQSRVIFGNRPAVPLNLDSTNPNVSYLALKIILEMPVIRQLMFLLAIADPQPLLGIHFDEWFKQIFSEDDFVLFGRPNVLTTTTGLLPHANPLFPDSLPTIANLVRQIQDPDITATFIYTVFLIANAQVPGVTLRWYMHVLTRRHKQGEQDASIYTFKGTSDNSSLTNYVQGTSTLNDIRTEVVEAMFSKFPEHAGSEFIHAEDLVTVLGISFKFETHLLPTPLNQLPVTLTGSQMRSAIQDMLRVLRAYRIPKALFDSLDKLSKKVPSTYSNDCLIEAFVYMRLFQTEKINDQMSRAEQKRIYMETVSDWPTEDFRQMNLYEALKFLLYMETEMWERHDQTGYVVLNFFGGFGRPPPCRSVRLILSEADTPENSATPGYDLDCDIASGDQYVFAENGSHLELVYYQGHMMVCTHDQFAQAVMTEGSYVKRIMHLTDEVVPEPYQWKPINAEKSKKERRQPAEMREHVLNKVQGCFCKDTHQCKTSADLETGTCVECSSREKREVQEAFSCGLAWGTKIEESICFSGQECLHAAKFSTFETYNGCITQMLRWMKANWGWYLQEQSTQHAPSKIMERVVYWFYGARFDMFFLKDVLLFWNENISMMPINGDLLKIAWGQYTFVDFARLYTGFSLDRCYETFKKVDIGAHSYLEYQPQSKWKAFPYLSIRSGLFERDIIPMEELESNNEIWGGKKANVDDERSIGVVNAEWWRANVSPDGFKVHEHLEEYCISDVLILQYCVCVHSWIMATGSMESMGVSKKYDLNRAITCSNMAMTLFRQVFLQDTITSPDPNIRLKHVDAISQKPLSLQACFQDAMKGGKTDCFRHCMFNEEREEVMNEWMRLNPDKAITVDDYDVNSMYPHIMESQLMPTQLTDIQEYEEGHEVQLNDDTSWANGEPLVDYYLYWVSISYPEKCSGILSKVNGFCISLQKIDFCYADPNRKDRMTYTMVYGRELRVAKTLYPTTEIWMKCTFAFTGTPLFKEYIQTLYKKRLESSSVLFKTFYKLMMNSTYGKLAQGLKPNNTLVYNNFDLMCTEEDRLWVDVQMIPGPYGNSINMLSTLDPSKSYIGQMIYMAAYITAGARSLLEELIFDAQKCVNQQGLPCLLYYVDTDSIKVCSIAPVRENQWFIDKWVHQSTLGMIKCEGTYDWIVMLGKKCGFFHEYDDSSPINSKEKLMMSLQSSGLKAWHVRSKGLPSKIVRPEDMMQVFMNGEKKTFILPDQLKRAMNQGITRVTGNTRSMGFRNLARKPPNANGTLEPYETAAQFIQVMKSKSPQERLNGLIHLE